MLLLIPGDADAASLEITLANPPDSLLHELHRLQRKQTGPPPR